jgi:hypothetical protein
VTDRDPTLFPDGEVGDLLWEAYVAGLIVPTGRFKNGKPMFAGARRATDWGAAEN